MRVVLIAVVLSVSCMRHGSVPIGNAGGSPDASAYGREVRQAYQIVRAATAPFHNTAAAAAAGYPAAVAQCIDSTHGAMGYHHVNRKYLSRQLEIDRPQILLYERDADGKYVLNGVEYIVPYRLWPRDTVAPSIMGRSLVRNDALQLWYMHMWAWKANPAGLFADWNPSVRCRSS